MPLVIDTPRTVRASWRIAALAATLAWPLVAGAHDLVLVPEPSGDLTVKFGHPGDWQPADKERLLDLRVEGDAQAAARPIAGPLAARGLELAASGVAAAGKAALVSARYDNGLWVSVPGADGKPVYRNTTKAMLPKATSTMSAIKFAKALYGTADDANVYKREVHHLVEIVPQKNPATVKPGETLPVLVKLAGKPLRGAGVEVTDAKTASAEGQAKFTTDASGIAQVPIRNAGLNVVSVDIDRRNDGSLGAAMKALPVDKIAMIATYAFQVR